MKRATRHAVHAALALGAAAGAWYGTAGWLADDYRQMDSTLASSGASLVGFVFAALAILLTVAEQPFVKTLNRLGYFSSLQGDLIWTAGLLLPSVALSIVAPLFPAEWARPVMAANLFFFTLGFCRMVRAGRNFALVLECLSGPSRSA